MKRMAEDEGGGAGVASGVRARWRRSRRLRFVVRWVVPLVLLFYLFVPPFVAGYLALGDRRGPKWYPEGWYGAVFLLGWESAEHASNKPRLGVNPPPRPWFWPLKSTPG